MLNRFILLTPLLAYLLCATSAAAAHGGELTRLRELREINRQSASRIYPNPDGRLAVYTSPTLHPATREGSRQTLRLLEIDSGKSQVISEDDAFASAPAWSPNGQYLAFISDSGGRPELWVWSRKSGKLQRFAQHEIAFIMPIHDIKPQWTPDSRRVLIPISERQLPDWNPLAAAAKPEPIVSRYPEVAARPVPDGDPLALRFREPVGIGQADVATGELIPIAKSRLRAHQMAGLLISPDGRKLALIGDATDSGWVGRELREDEIEASNLTIFDLTRPGESFVFQKPNELRKLGLAGNSSALAWSPDSQLLAMMSGRTDRTGTRPLDNLSRIFLVNPEAGTVRVLAGSSEGAIKFEQAARPLWAADGRHILLASQGDIWKVDVTGIGDVQNLTAFDGRRYVALLSPGRPDIFDPYAGKSMLGMTFSVASSAREPGRVYALAVEPETMAVEVSEFDESVAPRPRYRLEQRKITSAGSRAAARTADRALLLVSGQSQLSPNDWYALDPETGTGRILSIVDAPLARPWSDRRLVEWSLADGTKADGVLYLPPGTKAGARLPLVMIIYPGQTSYRGTLNSFNPDVTHGPELLVERGYAVLMAGIALDKGEPLEDILRGVDKALDSVGTIDLVDKDRVCVTGHSFGGYGVFALAAESKRFRCGIAVNGVADIGTAIADEYGEAWARGQGRMPVSVWSNQNLYLRNSPYYRMAAPKMPLLIFAGLDDTTVNPIQSALIYRAYIAHKTPVQLVKYRGADHSPHYWSQETLEDYWERIFSWLDLYLKTPMESEP